MSTLHALVATCTDGQVNIFYLTVGWSISTTCGQTECFVHPVLDYFWILQHYIACALAPSFVAAFPLSVHRSQYHIIIVFVPLPLCISPASVYSTQCPITSSSLAQSPLLLFCSFSSTWSSYALGLSNELELCLSIMEWNDENQSCPMKLERRTFIYGMYDRWMDGWMDG